MQPFILAQIKENIKSQRHWPLCGDFTGDQWIPRTNGQLDDVIMRIMAAGAHWPVFHCDLNLMRILFCSDTNCTNVMDPFCTTWNPQCKGLFKIQWPSDGQEWNLPNSQIPSCTCAISHNAPFRTEIFSVLNGALWDMEQVHSGILFWMEHYGIWNRWILAFEKLIYYSPKDKQASPTQDHKLHHTVLRNTWHPSIQSLSLNHLHLYAIFTVKKRWRFTYMVQSKPTCHPIWHIFFKLLGENCSNIEPEKLKFCTRRKNFNIILLWMQN